MEGERGDPAEESRIKPHECTFSYFLEARVAVGYGTDGMNTSLHVHIDIAFRKETPMFHAAFNYILPWIQ